MKHLQAQLLVLLMISSALSQANAASYSVSGYLYSVDAGIRGEFSVGENFLLTYEFDPLAIDVNSNIYRGEYYTVNGVANLTIGNYQVSAHGVHINVTDNLVGSNLSDIYRASSIRNSKQQSVFTGDEVAELVPYYWGIELFDTQSMVFSSDSLPSGQLDLSAFDSRNIDRRLELNFASEVTPIVAYGVQMVYGYVTHISAVPEPQSVWLWGVGVLALIGAIRVNKNSMGRA